MIIKLQGRFLVIFTCLMVLAAGCSRSHAPDFDMPYALEKPAKVYYLPPVLTEISGLAWLGDNKVLCVQDEEGFVYEFDIALDSITNSYKFAGQGDYESIEIVDDRVYVMRSDGVLFIISGMGTASQQTTEKVTALKSKHNPEGLCYDGNNNRLLIACKDKGQNDRKVIMSYNLETDIVEPDPAYTLDLEQLEDYLIGDGFTEFFNDLLEAIEGEDFFRPSAVDIHPVTGDIYVLSAKNELMVILNAKGKLLHVYDFHNELYRQPEGICFLPNGDLLISNEGQGGEPNILKFNYEAK